MAISQGPVTVLQNAVGATADGATLNMSGRRNAVFQVSGTFSATVTFEATLDGSNWSGLAVLAGSSTTATTLVLTATAAGTFYALDICGVAGMRARVTWTSGTSVTVIARASD